MNPIMDQFDSNVDVEVILESGERYFPTFFTVANVSRFIRESATQQVPGYCWAAQMIVVEQLSVEVIASCIEKLVQTGDIVCFAVLDP
ncbi:MAG: hypothetical protein R3E66_01120 [bacterium]